MTAWGFILLLAIIFAVIWVILGRRPGPRAKIGPDGTNVRDPETFVVHHEGKGQGLDIANTALKERTEHIRRDLPGNTHKIKAEIPGRSMTQMSERPSDISKYGDEKVAPGDEPKETVLMKGPKGSRPETPEEPGSPFAKGRRVTDTHRDVETAAELLPNLEPGTGNRKPGRRDVSPSARGKEPGYGLGKTGPEETDGEGAEDDYAVEQPEMTDEIPDISEGELASKTNRTWDALHEDLPLPDATICEEGIYAMVRNPRSLYVYWGHTGYQEGGQASVHCLKVTDITKGAAGHSFLIPVSEQDDHWFINEGIEPGRRYRVSHGWQEPNGPFHERAAADPVETPRAEPQSRILAVEGAPGQAPSSPWR